MVCIPLVFSVSAMMGGSITVWHFVFGLVGDAELGRVVRVVPFVCLGVLQWLLWGVGLCLLMERWKGE